MIDATSSMHTAPMSFFFMLPKDFFVLFMRFISPFRIIFAFSPAGGVLLPDSLFHPSKAAEVSLPILPQQRTGLPAPQGFGTGSPAF